MTNLIAVTDWLDLHGEPLEPSAMQFTIRPATSCRGCIFNGQRSRVCTKATEAAQRADLPHCEEGFIYVPKETDPRQLSITSNACNCMCSCNILDAPNNKGVRE